MKTAAVLMAAALAFTSSLQAHGNHAHSSSETNETQPDFSHGYREIQTDALSKLVRSANPLLMIVDARMPEYDDGKRIPGAKVIPVNATIENITANLPDKQAMIVVYCENAQCPASGLLADRLVRMGYKNVWKYKGGIEEWEARGQKIERGKTGAEAAAETGPKSA
jgi:rhodanese-related sulfurtransferase